MPCLSSSFPSLFPHHYVTGTFLPSLTLSTQFSVSVFHSTSCPPPAPYHPAFLNGVLTVGGADRPMTAAPGSSSNSSVFHTPWADSVKALSISWSAPGITHVCPAVCHTEFYSRFQISWLGLGITNQHGTFPRGTIGGVCDNIGSGFTSNNKIHQGISVRLLALISIYGV